jgi:hypothetical protein
VHKEARLGLVCPSVSTVDLPLKVATVDPSPTRLGGLHLLPRHSELDPFLGSTAYTSFRDAAACTSFPVAAACIPSPAAKDRGGGRLRVLPLFLYLCVHDGGGVLRRRPGGCVRRGPGGGGRGDPYTIFLFSKIILHRKLLGPLGTHPPRGGPTGLGEGAFVG